MDLFLYSINSGNDVNQKDVGIISVSQDKTGNIWRRNHDNTDVNREFKKNVMICRLVDSQRNPYRTHARD